MNFSGKQYPRWLQDAGAILLLLALWFIFFWRVFTPAPEDRLIFNQQGDFILHFYSPIAYQMERFASGEIPYWNVYNYSGEPSAANIQNGTFYLPRFIIAAVAGGFSVPVYQLEVTLHYLIASLTMYAFLRIAFRSRAIALVGGVMFAYSGYATAYPMLQASTIETEAWMPLALLGIYLSITRPSWRIRGAQLSIAAVALMLLAGRPQAALYLMYVIAGYLVVLGWHHGLNLKGIFWRCAVIFGIGGALAAIQLLPMAQFMGRSFRLDDYGFVDKGGGFTPESMVHLIWPMGGGGSSLYIGIAGVMLAIGTMMRRKSPIEWFWLITGAVALFLSMGLNSAAFDTFFLAVPGFSLFRNQERWAAQVALALIMLAVHHLAYLWQDDGENRPDYHRVIYGMAGFMVALFILSSLSRWMATLDEPASDLVHVLSFSALIVGLFVAWERWRSAEPRPLAVAVALLLPIIALDLLTIGKRNDNLVPDAPHNYLQLDPLFEPYRQPNGDIQWRLDGAGGLQAHGAYFQIADIYGLGGISLDTPEQLNQLPVDRRWEILAVRYLTSTVEPPLELVPMTHIGDSYNYWGQPFRLFEFLNPRPMAHLVYANREADGSVSTAREIIASPHINLREEGVTLNPLPFELSGQRPELSEVRDFHMLTPERVEMNVSTGADALLTVSIINYPGWRATVNGESVEVVDNYAGLIGIPLRAGENLHVVLTFTDDRLVQGAIISALALFVLVGLTFIPRLSKSED